MTDEPDTIRALATVTLDARALESLGPKTLDLLADLVEARMAERRAAGQEPLLSAAAAAELVGVHPSTLRSAIRAGAIEVAGYVGKRPRVRRTAVEAWLAAGRPPTASSASDIARATARRGRSSTRRVLRDALADGDRAA